MKPEEQSRLEIDAQLQAAGWIVQDRKELNIHAGPGVAVREFPLLTGEADYMLYADAKAIGVVEAKPVGHTLKGVELQSAKYLNGLPPNLPHYHLPLPFGYETTGKLTQFTNTREPHARSRPVFTFHTPAELIRLANLDNQVRTRLQTMPALDAGRLWSIQATSIQNLERSLADNRPARSFKWPLAAAKPTPRSRSAIGSSSTPVRSGSCSSWTATIWASKR